MEAGCDDFIGKPLRASELFRKLERHLKVKYIEREKRVPSDLAAERTVGAEETLPPELARDFAKRIREAAELGDMSELTAVATELTGQTNATSRYGDEIGRLAKAFDFAGLQQLADSLDETAAKGME